MGGEFADRERRPQQQPDWSEPQRSIEPEQKLPGTFGSEEQFRVTKHPNRGIVPDPDHPGQYKFNDWTEADQARYKARIANNPRLSWLQDPNGQPPTAYEARMMERQKLAYQSTSGLNQDGAPKGSTGAQQSFLVAGAISAPVPKMTLWEFTKRQLIKRSPGLAAKLAGLAVSDGPLPIGEIIGLGVAAWELKQIHDEYQNVMKSQHGRGKKGDSGILDEADDLVHSGRATNREDALTKLKREAEQANNGKGDQKKLDRIKATEKALQSRPSRETKDKKKKKKK